MIPSNTQFQFRILYFYTILDVCKKLDLQILKIDRVTAIFSLKENIFKNV